MEPIAKLFGSPARTKVLVSIALLRDTFPQELARVLDLSRLSVQRIVNDLEREGVLVSRTVGRNRMVELNRRMFGGAELEAFLIKYAQGLGLEEQLAQLRRRPRRTGKAI